MPQLTSTQLESLLDELKSKDYKTRNPRGYSSESLAIHRIPAHDLGIACDIRIILKSFPSGLSIFLYQGDDIISIPSPPNLSMFEALIAALTPASSAVASLVQLPLPGFEE